MGKFLRFRTVWGHGKDDSELMTWGKIRRTFMCVVAGATGAIAVSAITQSAWAVDIVNADKTPRDVVVNDSNGQSKSLTLAPKKKLLDVCSSCVVLSGDTSAEAEDDMVVTIENGKVSAHAK